MNTDLGYLRQTRGYPEETMRALAGLRFTGKGTGHDLAGAAVLPRWPARPSHRAVLRVLLRLAHVDGYGFRPGHG